MPSTVGSKSGPFSSLRPKCQIRRVSCAWMSLDSLPVINPSADTVRGHLEGDCETFDESNDFSGSGALIRGNTEELVAESVTGSSTCKMTELVTDSGYASLGKDEQHDVSTTKEATDGEVDEVDETATVYSGSWSLPSNEADAYKSEFAETLIETIRRRIQTEDGILLQTFKALPGLLKAFALRLGRPGSSQAEREVMYFIHKHRA